MIPHVQTDTSPTTGNCWQTAIACVIEQDPDRVPHFVKADTDGIVSDWWLYSQYWLHYHGYELSALGRHLYTNEHYLVMGYTVRETYHVCVYLNGKMVHDPHPSGAGLTKELETVVIRNY